MPTDTTRPVTVNDRGHFHCPHCRCEVGMGPDPTNLTPLGRVPSAKGMLELHSQQYGKMTDENLWSGFGEGQPIMDPTCECSCHDVWRQVYGVRP